MEVSLNGNLQKKYKSLVEGLTKSKILAIFTLKDPSIAVQVAESLLAGGIKIMEITFRTQNAAESLKKIKEANLPICVGAGTIRTIQQAEDALKSGAEFFVTPGYNPKIVEWAINHEIPIFPGIDSTIGIEHAADVGLDVLKYFPADIGGLKWLKAMNGPYLDIKFIPTGGVSLTNMKDFLALPNVIAVAGSFLAPPQLIEQKKFAEITEICKNALKSIE